MSGKEDNRIFIGGLSWNTTQRRLEQEFGRFGKVIDAQVMMERDTGRPRGFGFVTFTDPRSVKDAISEMHNRDLDGRVISVNKAEPKMGSEDPGYGGNRGRGYHDDGPPPVGRSDVCYKCGRQGHWARECPDGSGGGKFSSNSRYAGDGAGRGDRFGGPDRYVDDRYDGGRYGDRNRIDSRDRFGGDRDRYATDRYAPVGDRFSGDRYGGLAPDRYPQNGYNKERSYERDAGPRGGSSYDRDGGPRGGGYDKYGPRSGYDRDGPRGAYDRDGPRGGGGGGGSDKYRSGGPIRFEGGAYRDRPGPYDRPSRGGRPSTYDDRY